MSCLSSQLIRVTCAYRSCTSVIKKKKFASPFIFAMLRNSMRYFETESTVSLYNGRCKYRLDKKIELVSRPPKKKREKRRRR